MKYCHECGAKLENKEENSNPIKIKEGANHKKNKLLKAASILAIIITILCTLIGIISINSQDLLKVESSYSNSYHSSSYHQSYHLSTGVLMTGIFGLFGLIFGTISSVSIYTRKMFSITIIGLGVIFTAAVFSATLGLFAFILLGLPILILGTIITVFTCISKKEFSS